MSDPSSYARSHETLFGRPPPDRAPHGESRAPVFAKASGFLRGFDLTMQVQVGCPGGCLYCYVPSNPYFTSERARGRDGRLWGFRVFNKVEAVEQTAAALEAGALADRTIYWSGVTHPYAAPPATTRAIWDRLTEARPELRPRRLAVQTRFLPDRDAELMSQYVESARSSDGGPPVVVSYSIGTDRDDLIRAWEKSTPSFEQRMSAVATLRERGVTVIPTLSPFAYWNDLASTLGRFQALNIPYITVLFFKQLDPWSKSANTPQRFLEYLRREHPLLLDAGWQADRLVEMEAIYGRSRVLAGQPGFASLTSPHAVCDRGSPRLDSSLKAMS
jgi:DNA repair photolyase